MTRSPHERLHHLDALRAFAMLLGVALHAALSFSDMDWPVRDVHAGPAPGLPVAAVHGFRMQLFFLLSGAFSMGLLRHRGTAGFLSNRARRIALPLAVSCATVLPATWGTIWLVSGGEGPRSLAQALSPLPWPAWLLAFPLLGHLWFLWFLCWLGAALVATAWLARSLPRPRIPAALVRSPLALLWLVPGTAALAAPMGAWGTQPSFGADTSAGVLPMPHVLAYYGAFFGFGALAATVPGAIGGIGRGWWAWLALATVAFLPAAAVGGLAPEAERLFPDPGTRRTAGLLLGSAYAWCMCLGLVGLAARLLRSERRWVRWVADSSYWVYLVHLPVVLAFQRAVAGLPCGGFAKFVAVLLGTMAVSLASYRLVVRGRWIGRMLNGAHG